MEEEQFRKFLKKSGRSDSAVAQIDSFLSEFDSFYSKWNPGKPPSKVSLKDLEDFVAEIESIPKVSAKKHLWALAYWFDFVKKPELLQAVRDMRHERIRKTPFKVGKFVNVNQDYVQRLLESGIENVTQMLDAGRTPTLRQELADKTRIPLDSIIEFVKLSDLTRVGALRSVRARLYHDAGVDTPEKLAAWNPEELRQMFLEFIEKSGFEGIAPLPKEVLNAVESAKKLPKIVEY